LEADDILFSKQMTVHELSMSVRGVPVTDNNLIQ